MFNLIDLYVSPPLLFTFRQTVTVSPDLYYRFDGTKAVFTPSRPIMPNATYLFHEIHLSADIDELDYEASYGQIAGENFPRVPQFQIYNPIDAAAPFFREPVQVARYLNNIKYMTSFVGKELIQNGAYSNLSTSFTPASDTDNDGLQTAYITNRLLGSFFGALQQTASLVGKSSITITAMIPAQEVTDDELILKDVMNRRKLGG